MRIVSGSMDKGSTIQELSRSHVLPLDREDIFSIPMEEVARTIIMAPRMVIRMEEATARTVPTHQPRPRETRAKSLALSARRPDIMPMNVLNPRMEMAMEALGRSRTLSIGDR